MFRHQGTSRSDRQNRLLAGYLAFVGGFVNSVGFVLIGSFTSHVTGLVGRATNNFANLQVGAGAAALTMVIAFYTGAFLASVIVESNVLGAPGRSYGLALFVEGALLSIFAAWSWGTAWVAAHPRLADAQGILLCMAMGMQNSLVTRLSGAVVRTTHLTGVFTDLGIESARWFRWWRKTAEEKLRIRLVVGPNAPELPHKPKLLLLLTIASSFVTGALVGALVVGKLAHASMVIAAGAVFAFAIFAVIDPQAKEESPINSRR